MIRFSFLFACCVSLLTCFSCNSTPETSTASTSRPPVDEDDVLLRLSSQLIPSPSSQVEKERNQLLEYALDKLLDVQESPEGFFYQSLQEGTGEPAKWGDYVTAHYEGNFLNGKIFDSSYQRKEPLSFYIGNMIKGWNEGLALMKTGSKMLFLIPSNLAYGEKGLGKAVPPNTPLIFEVELLKIEKRAKE